MRQARSTDEAAGGMLRKRRLFKRLSEFGWEVWDCMTGYPGYARSWERTGIVKFLGTVTKEVNKQAGRQS